MTPSHDMVRFAEVADATRIAITRFQTPTWYPSRMPPTQCLGITLKGQRCLKKVADGSWCNYHVSQGSKASMGKSSKSASPQRTPRVPPRSSSPQKQGNHHHHRSPSPTPAKYSAQSPGFIYVYTLQSFLEDKAGTIKTRNLINSAKNRDQWVDMKIKKSKMLLIKVGMTTKTPAIRISQWEAKCNHKLRCLYPNSYDFKSTSLMDRFRALSLNSRPAENRFFSTFHENSKGFYVPRDVLHCERDIHGLLKQKFGRGEIHCTGCVDKTKAAASSRSGLSLSNLLAFKPKEPEFNVHNEWFPVPKNMIHEVYSIIDSVCQRYR